MLSEVSTAVLVERRQASKQDMFKVEDAELTWFVRPGEFYFQTNAAGQHVGTVAGSGLEGVSEYGLFLWLRARRIERFGEDDADRDRAEQAALEWG